MILIMISISLIKSENPDPKHTLLLENSNVACSLFIGQTTEVIATLRVLHRLVDRYYGTIPVDNSTEATNIKHSNHCVTKKVALN